MGAFRVFPTCVGVFRRCWERTSPMPRFPHMRGGVPRVHDLLNLSATFSPHAWGCSDEYNPFEAFQHVFPTCVGVFRRNVPPFVFVMVFSPHAWGCSVRKSHPLLNVAVFPTCVGVFRHITRFRRHGQRFPHMRGGVPVSNPLFWQPVTFSPHAWGCSARLTA